MYDQLRDKLLHILHKLVGELACDRALVACAGAGFAHGLSSRLLCTAEEGCQKLLQGALHHGQPGIFERSPSGDSLISVLRAALFVPIRDRYGRMVGMVYADGRAREGDFQIHEVFRVQALVRNSLMGLEPELEDAQEMDWDTLSATCWN